jgi:cardiolipin synthase
MKFFIHNFNIPNSLTAARLFMSPFLFIALFNGNTGLGLTLLISSGITDFLDGWSARILNQESHFGKIFDPLVDRLFTACLLLGLFFMDSFPLWLLILLLSRELIIATSIFLLNHFYGETIKIRVLWSGKATMFTTFSLVAVILALHTLSIDAPLFLYYGIYVFWTFMLIYSLVDYACYYIPAIKNIHDHSDHDRHDDHHHKTPKTNDS